MKKNVFLGEEFVESVLHSIGIKDEMSSNFVSRFLMRAIMAGIVIAFAYIMIMKMEAVFNGSVDFLGTMVGSILFSFALITIYYTKSELLTSNMMMTSVGVYYKEISVKKMFQIMVLCYLGNFLGGLIVALLVVPTTVISGNEGMVEYIHHAMEIKQGYIADGNYIDLLVRAIFANFFINIAMLMVYSGNIKNDVAKMIVMMYGVFMFINLGFEHSVANTELFTIAAVYELKYAIDVGFEFGLAVGNVLIALVGNFIGGGVLIGLYYAFVNDSRKTKIQ